MDTAQTAKEFERFVRELLFDCYVSDHDLSRDDSHFSVGAFLDQVWVDDLQPKIAAVWYALPESVRAAEELQSVAANVMAITHAVYVERPTYPRAQLDRAVFTEHGITGLRADLLWYRDRDAAKRAEQDLPFGPFEWPPGVIAAADLKL